jgi:hypothetical protein
MSNPQIGPQRTAILALIAAVLMGTSGLIWLLTASGALGVVFGLVLLAGAVFNFIVWRIARRR